MVKLVDPEHPLSLDDYEAVGHLAGAVRELRAEAGRLVPRLKGRTVWMVNSTALGGGVAEMLPRMVTLLSELGVDVRWVVMETGDAGFFPLTKRIHNLIHGEGDPELTAADRALYEAVSRENAASLRPRVSPGDVLVVHDPQPLGMGAVLKEETGVHSLWRCHIGLDRVLPQTRAAWDFLQPYAAPYDRAVFSVPEYIPGFLAGRSSIIHPALDPLGAKNRTLSVHALVGILCNAALAEAHGPVLMKPFPEPARRLQPDGGWQPAAAGEEIGLLYRPIVTQVSRWDRLKGFLPLLQGFVRLKEAMEEGRAVPDEHRHTLKTMRLVLAGPDPESVQDDPEAREVLTELSEVYQALPPDIQRDVALLSLPMRSPEHNALMVNALQRCSTIVAQNSLREGFGLTVTEAMWKHAAVMGSRAAGIRQQVRDGLDGRLVADPADPAEVASVLDEMLADPRARQAWGRSAQRRVHDEFLIFTQLRRWLEVLSDTP